MTRLFCTMTIVIGTAKATFGKCEARIFDIANRTYNLSCPARDVGNSADKQAFDGLLSTGSTTKAQQLQHN